MDWEDIKVFHAVIQNGTIRRAANMLAIHHSTVSRRIEALETDIGTRLFDRCPDGLQPTSAGEELAKVAREFSLQLNDTGRHIAGQDNVLKGKVTVTMAEPLATLAIVPELPAFCDQYPGLEVEIKATYELLDVSRREADIAVRMDNNPPETLVGKRLFPYHNSVYAAPGYLQNHDLQNSPEKMRWLGWSDEPTLFPSWTQGTELANVPVWGNFNNLNLQVALAKAGMGIAMLPCFIADQTEGLVRITSKAPQPGRDIWILTHNDLRQTARIRALMNFIEEQLRAQKNRFLGNL